MLQHSEQAASLKAGSDNNQASLSQRQMPVWKDTTERIRQSLCSLASVKRYWWFVATTNDKISYFLHYFMRILLLWGKGTVFMNISSLRMRRHSLLLRFLPPACLFSVFSSIIDS